MTNVIPDPGFETGTGDWVCSRGTTVATVARDTTIVHTGTGAARMTRTAAVDTGTFNIRQGSTRYTTRPGERWSGRAWVYNGTSTSHQMSCSLVWRNAAGTETFISSANVTPPVNTWTQLTMPSTVMPAGAVDVIFQVNFGTNYAPNEFVVLDDVYLAQGALLNVASLASVSGYGWWRFNITTDPPQADGTSFTLTPYAGATGVPGNLTDGGDAFVDRLINNLAAGTKTATVDVTFAGTAQNTWTFQQLAYQSFTVFGTRLDFLAWWAPKGGGSSNTDASVDWGDGSPVQNLLQADGNVGSIQAAHLYPVLAGPATYTTVLTSGAQLIARNVLIPGSARSAITTEDGTQRVSIDLQEWPSFLFPRTSAVLPVQGREEPIVLTDVIRLPSTEITFLARTLQEGTDLLQILKFRGRLNIASPCSGVQSIWMIVLGIERIRLTNRGDEVRRLFQVQAQQVNAP